MPSTSTDNTNELLESSSDEEQGSNSNNHDILELEAVTDTEENCDQESLETVDTIDIVQGTFLLVKFSCPKNSYKYYVGRVSEVVDETKNIFYVTFLRKQKTDKSGIHFIYPNTKDLSLIEEHQIFKILKDVKFLRRDRFQFPSIDKYDVRIE